MIASFVSDINDSIDRHIEQLADGTNRKSLDLESCMDY